MPSRFIRHARQTLAAAAVLATLTLSAQADPSPGQVPTPGTDTSAAPAGPTTCSAPESAQIVSARATRLALEAARAATRGQPSAAAARAVALNGRGYNYGAPVDLDASLLRLRAEATGR